MTLSGRDFLKEADFTSAELDTLLRLAAEMAQQLQKPDQTLTPATAT